MGFSRQEHWSELLGPPPGDLPNLGIEPGAQATPALQADSLLLSHRGSPLLSIIDDYYIHHEKKMFLQY